MCVAISDANFNISKHTLRFFFQRLQTHSSTFFFRFFLRNFGYPVVRSKPSKPKELWVSLGIHVSYEMRSRTENFPTTLPCGPPHLPPRPSAFVASGGGPLGKRAWGGPRCGDSRGAHGPTMVFQGEDPTSRRE